MSTWSTILNIFMPMTISAINPDCDYLQDLKIGQKYYIFNNEYPHFYGPNTACRWIAWSPLHTKIYLSCSTIEIPSSKQCLKDRLAVSLNGDEKLMDSHNYCGKGSVSLFSEKNTIALALFSTKLTSGGRLLCSLTAIRDDDEEEIPEEDCDCGWRGGTRIVNGVDASPHEFPSMGALKDIAHSVVEESQFCGVSIISPKYVLTAAHCFENRNLSNIRVILGAHNITDPVDTGRRQTFTIANVKKHPKYNLTTVASDIAIIQLNGQIQYSVHVGPICLPFIYSGESFVDKEITALGWGQQSFSDGNSKILQKVELDVVNCSLVPADWHATSKNLCTFKDGKDTCIADSGGPLLWWNRQSRKLFLIGLVSFGEGCGGDLPSLNTRLTSYLEWIVKETEDSYYCVKK